MSSIEKLVPFARIQMRSLQLCLADHWNRESGLTTSLPVTTELRQMLFWWATASRLSSGQSIKDPPAELLLFSDASGLGWVVHPGDREAQGLWTEEEKRSHINLLELRAVL